MPSWERPSRRRFIASGAAASAAFSLPALATGEVAPASGPRVVVVGGGWGGCVAAKYIRLQDSAIEVTLVEPEAAFVSCPISNWVIGGLKTMDDISMSYDALASRHGVRILRDRAVGVDPAARAVHLGEGGFLRYDRAVLSPGIALRRGDIDGLEDLALRRLPGGVEGGRGNAAPAREDRRAAGGRRRRPFDSAGAVPLPARPL